MSTLVAKINQWTFKKKQFSSDVPQATTRKLNKGIVMSVWMPVKTCFWDRQFTYLVWNVVSSLIAFSKKALVPTCSLRSEFADTLVTSRREDAFIDLIANSILGAIMLSKVVKIAFCILSSTVSMILLISLSIFSLKHLSKVFTLIAFPLITELFLEVPTVKSRSLVPSLTTGFSCLSLTALPLIISWSKSSNWLRSLLFDCLFLQVEIMFVLITELLKEWKFKITQRVDDTSNRETCKEFYNHKRVISVLKLF